jgi:hypothetical protein
MQTFSSDQLGDLQEIREKSGISSKNPYHKQCPFPGQAMEYAQSISEVSQEQDPISGPDKEHLVNVITQVVTSVIRNS